MNTIMHPVILAGGGDSSITLVGPATFEWIHGDWPKTSKTFFDEAVPIEVQAEFATFNKRWNIDPSKTISITRGSFDNDRALLASGRNFDSLKDAIEWCRMHDVHLGDHYIGHIY